MGGEGTEAGGGAVERRSVRSCADVEKMLCGFRLPALGSAVWGLRYPLSDL